MSQKAKFIFGTYIAAALVALSLCCAIGYSRLTDYRRAAAYSSRAAFATTVKAVDSMGAAMKKSLYATDGGLCSSLCGQVYASASAAEAAMLSLPFATEELENLASFLNLAGDYAYSLAPAAAENGFEMKEGVYLQFQGPNFETPTEIKMFRGLGADAVGMSTVCEAIAARHMGLRIAAVSCITNMAAGILDQPLSHEEVQETADKVAGKFEKLITGLIARIGEEK